MGKTMDIEDRIFLDELYKKYSLELYKIARHRLCDEEKAKDAVQMVFLVASGKIPDIRVHTNVKLWFFATLKNVVKQILYDKKYTKEKLLREFILELVEKPVWDQYEFENIGMIKELKPYLKEREYKYLVERFIYDKSNKELAEVFDLSYSGITSFGDRVLKKAKKILEKNEKNF